MVRRPPSFSKPSA